ncbi:MAG: NAD-dependent epimerase/dehydratase family protein [Myxococcales bacterium]|nr:NAD-dependent epimerase/dehydratase family protein [Myxococcales bacterium]
MAIGTVFLTGATGYIGGHTARALLARGYDVIAYCRSVERAEPLIALGCKAAFGDLSNEDALYRGMASADTAVHAAAAVEMGLVDPKAMWETNVVGTLNVLKAAGAQGLDRIVVVSSVDHFGGTHGRWIDETFRHKARFATVYEFTKHHATLAAFKMQRDDGLPLSVVYPGRSIGADDPNFGPLWDLYARRRLFALVGARTFASYAAVEDVAEGIVLALERGRAGEGYMLCESSRRLADVFKTAERLTGIPAPRIHIPDGVAKGAARAVQWLFRNTNWIPPVKGGQPPLSVELARGAIELNARHSGDKARAELGWSPRPFDEVLAGMLPWYIARARS